MIPASDHDSYVILRNVKQVKQTVETREVLFDLRRDDNSTISVVLSLSVLPKKNNQLKYNSCPTLMSLSPPSTSL